MGLELGKMLLNIGFRAVSGFVPGGTLVQLTVEELGPAFCEAAWAKLKDLAPGERRAALEQLGQIDMDEARALAEQSLQARGDLAPELRAQAVEYLAAIPMSARRSLVQDGAAGLSLPAAQVPQSRADVLRLLPLRPPLFRPGQALASHDWLLERLLGQGGFGEVWLATNPRRPRAAPCALKFCVDAEMRRSLERETELLDRLEAARAHPGIVRLLETALSAEPPFLVYEYVDGGDLTRWLANSRTAAPGPGEEEPEAQAGSSPASAGRGKRARVPAAKVAALLLQIADTLAFTHRLGLVHCDLKPSNVLIGRGGEVKLTDFGIGRVVADAEFERKQGGSGLRSATTQWHSVLQGACTPMYADRAQRRGEAIDARADVYAVGVMAYQLLLGDVAIELSPYFREELDEAGVPAELAAVVAGCVAIPDRRYRDGAALLEALEPVARGLRVFDGAPEPAQAPAGAVRPEVEARPVQASASTETSDAAAGSAAAASEASDASGAMRRERTPAEEAAARGGKPGGTLPLVLRTRRRVYTLERRLHTGPVASVHSATAVEQGRERRVCVKIVNAPEDGEFLENEARILRHLRADRHCEGFTAYVPEPIETFRVADPGTRKLFLALATAPYERWTSLERIVSAYPGGVDPRDMAWMFKRILGLTAVAHAAGVLHCSLIPPFVGLDLERHEPFFADWPFAMLAREVQPLRAIVPGFEAYYPPEVYAKEAPGTATDVYMIGKCMIRLLGGDLESGELPEGVPAPIRRLLRASTLPEASRRLDDAWQLHQEFDSQLERMFGPKKFRKFTLP